MIEVKKKIEMKKEKSVSFKEERKERIEYKVQMILSRYGFSGPDDIFEGLIRSEHNLGIRNFLTDMQELVSMVVRGHQCKSCRKE